MNTTIIHMSALAVLAGLCGCDTYRGVMTYVPVASREVAFGLRFALRDIDGCRVEEVYCRAAEGYQVEVYSGPLVIVVFYTVAEPDIVIISSGTYDPVPVEAVCRAHFDVHHKIISKLRAKFPGSVADPYVIVDWNGWPVLRIGPEGTSRQWASK